MKKIIDYMIVQEEEIENLETRIVKYLEQGWQPIGGIAYAVYQQEIGGYTKCTQAMVLYEN